MKKLLLTLLTIPFMSLFSIEKQDFYSKNHHGIALPLSAIRASQDCGIGEYLDLIPLIDWCKEVHFDVIQLLPLNDTGNDPSPYNPMSAFALHPVYLSLHALPFMDEELIAELGQFQDLNGLQRVAYHEVLQKKLLFLKKYYEKKASLLLQEKEYEDFLSKNEWVKTYSLFKALTDQYGEGFRNWPEELQRPKLELLEKYRNEISFYSVLQFLSFRQFKQAKEYAASSGVLLKGDISILISRDSVDCWANPEIFDFSLAVGAPPDKYYNADGQYWGFPLYNWETLREKGFTWWKDRIKAASNFYDLFRIDHATGFFRIWAIPLNDDPKKGKFLPEDSNLWFSQGKEILGSLMKASSMFAISEDIPIGNEEDDRILTDIQKYLRELGIFGTKMMRWEKDAEGSFIPSKNYPTLTMTTVSNHDIEPLQLWWQKYPEDAKVLAECKNWEYSPNLDYQKRLAILRDSHQSASLLHINPLQEYLAFFPELVWEKAEDERINVPGTIQPTNWAYRFRISLDEMLSHEGLKESMGKVLAQESYIAPQ